MVSPERGCQMMPYVDQIVGDHPQTNPALPAFLPAIQTPIPSVPSFENADPSFAASSPALTLFEPALFLLGSPLRTSCLAIRNRNTLHAACFQLLLVCLCVETRVGRYRMRYA